MNIFHSKIVTSLVLLSVSAPAALADYHNQYDGANSAHHHGHDSSNDWKHNNRHYKHSKWNSQHYPNSNWQTKNVNSWKWDKHNWNDQRAQLRADWLARHNRLTVQQQQQLDAQLKAQWLQYHHNSWNGQYTWNQYSDPRFLDYLHTQNPSLLTTIRTTLGF